MMRSVKLPAVAMAGLSFAAGCDREESPTPSTAVSTAPAVPSTSASDTPAAPVPDASAIATDARQRAAAAESDVRGGPTTATTRAQTQPAATTTAAQMSSDEAKKMLDQAMTYLRENKYDLAEKSLNQVEANKAMLPKAIQDQLGTVRSALATAKARGDLKLPGFGAGSK